MAINTGGNVSKVNAYVVLERPPGGYATKVAAFFVLAGGPWVLSVDPVKGRPGSSATIRGQRFTGATAVTFGGTPAASFAVVSDTEITATVPERDLGVVDVAVTGGGLTSTLRGAFEVADPYRIDSLSPSPVHAGVATELAILGAGYELDSVVKVDGLPVAASFVSDSELRVQVGPRDPGTVTVEVSFPSAGETRSRSLTFEAAAFSSVAPGQARPGTQVTLAGRWFYEGAIVLVGGVEAPATWVSSTELRISVPWMAAGVYDVEIRNAAAGYTETLTRAAALEVLAPLTPLASGPIELYVVP